MQTRDGGNCLPGTAETFRSMRKEPDDLHTPSISEKARMARLQAMDRAQQTARQKEQESENTQIIRKVYKRQIRQNTELKEKVSTLEQELAEYRQTPEPEELDTEQSGGEYIDELYAELDQPDGTESEDV